MSSPRLDVSSPNLDPLPLGMEGASLIEPVIAPVSMIAGMAMLKAA